MATHTSGSGFLDWGAGVGFDLRSQAYYDARDYAGIAFWARAGSDVEQDLRVEVTDKNTSPLGLLCTPLEDEGGAGAPSSGYDCHDNFGATLVLSQQWQPFFFFWDELVQRNWSGQAFDGIDADAIYGFRFQAVQLDEQNLKPDFDFWIDDVSFICPTVP
jgi:hypothetical protein